MIPQCFIFILTRLIWKVYRFITGSVFVNINTMCWHFSTFPWKEFYAKILILYIKSNISFSNLKKFLRKLNILSLKLKRINRATAKAVPAPKKTRGEVALYYPTCPKQPSPHFDNHAQPPWEVRIQRAFPYEKNSTTGFRCRLRRVGIQFESKLMKHWNLLFWAYNVVNFLLLLVHSTLLVCGFEVLPLLLEA